MTIYSEAIVRQAIDEVREARSAASADAREARKKNEPGYDYYLGQAKAYEYCDLILQSIARHAAEPMDVKWQLWSESDFTVKQLPQGFTITFDREE
jgi:hypothetical protein